MSSDEPCNCEQALALQEEIKKLKNVVEVAELFLTDTCTCASLSDQGAICKHCRLREMFEKLGGV